MSSVDLDKIGANKLKNCTSGEMVEIDSLWHDQTSILFFLRRFGCQVCWWMAAEVSKLEKDLKTNSIALIGIGPEETGVKEFKDGGFFKGDIYIDEKNQCYKDLGLKRYNAINVVGKKVREIASKASTKGIHGNFSGDLLQSGGMLIVAKGGEKVLLHFVQKTPADSTSLDDITKALRISANVQAGEKPQCNDEVCTRYRILCSSGDATEHDHNMDSDSYPVIFFPLV
ncbi:prostamide/prostaglandin F synthase-like [Myxocyprinus asiaticus]|uniref:prostamide/prostaglandin F synthase-like n=1 Tax=Myxocyprinus asiaticus TaxID=70543 RepID=UPI002221A834|nr:prostamide/prostaglandin F synthase-like [Myxocyprinus asiaticus]